jgi:hypothetical protein
MGSNCRRARITGRLAERWARIAGGQEPQVGWKITDGLESQAGWNQRLEVRCMGWKPRRGWDGSPLGRKAESVCELKV